MHQPQRLKLLALPPVVGIVVAWALLAGLERAAAGLTGGGADLGALAAPYEVALDASGRLWLSEYGLDQARHVDPATGAYTLYTGLPGILDAKLDASGVLWWASYTENTIGRLDPATGQGATYTIKVSLPWQFSFDAGGKLWIMDDGAAGLTTFDPDIEEECHIALPNDGQGSHNFFHAGALWVSDYENDAILRITPTTNALTSWPISTTVNSWPSDLDLEVDGTVWFGDQLVNQLGRLEPDTGEVTIFTPTSSSRAVTVLAHDGRTWYTGPTAGTLGYVNANAASDATWTVAPITGTLTPSCYTNDNPNAYAAGMVTGTLLFDAFALTTTTTAEGAVYFLPAGNRAWGVARAGDELWVSDAGLGHLYRVGLFEKLFLPLIAK